MKKLLLGTLLVAAMAQPVMAEKGIWDRNKGITLGFVTHQGLKDDGPLQLDSKFGFSLSVGTQYLWPRSEGWAGNRIKVGLDVRWFDITYVNYKNTPSLRGDFDPDFDYDYGYGSDADDWDYGDYDDDLGEFDFDLGSHQLHMGLGIGPAVVVAPFSNMDNGARFLRANLYAHFNPQASALIYKTDDSTKFAWSFVPGIDYGINFQWKWFTLGVEGRWGRGKYNIIGADDEGDYDYDDISGIGDVIKKEKVKMSTPSFRVMLGFRF